ncbi:MAG TPA: hypothetical protein VIH24_08585 [Candidatus Limnocylindria bacterium]
MVSSENPREEDDSVLERIGDAVAIVLADDLEPIAEDPWERRQRLLDSWTAIVAIARTDASGSATAATTDLPHLLYWTRWR